MPAQRRARRVLGHHHLHDLLLVHAKPLGHPRDPGAAGLTAASLDPTFAALGTTTADGREQLQVGTLGCNPQPRLSEGATRAVAAAQEHPTRP